MIDNSWRQRALCRDRPPQEYELDGIRLKGRLLALYARKVCTDCPVVAQCAASAARMGDVGVIRAGVPLMMEGGTKLRRGRLGRAIIDGTVEPLSEKEQALIDRPSAEVDDATRVRQAMYMVQRKLARWERRTCEKCSVPVKPEGIPDTVWSDRSLTGDPHWRTRLCISCTELHHQKLEETA